MKYCKYTIASSGQVFQSYSELLDFLENKLTNGELEGITDIVFSKVTKQEAQKETLNKVKVEGIEEARNSSLIDGEPILKNRLSVLEFLNSEYANINEKPLVTPFSTEDYINQEVSILVEKGVDKEEASRQILSQVNNWDKIQEDGLWLHKLVCSSTYMEDDDSDFINKLTDIPERLKNDQLLATLHQQLKQRWISEKGKYTSSLAYRGLNIKSKLKGLDKEIFGKIDWLFLGQDGVLHMYLFKTTTGNPNDWSRVKLENYLNQLAFLKQMLANNKVDVTDIEMSIIPIQVNYNEDYTNARDIKVLPTKHYSTRFSGTGYAMEKYDKYARYFITSNYMPFHVSSQPIDRALEVCRNIFPDANIRDIGIDKSAREWIKNAPDTDPQGIEPLVIKKVNENDHTYEVVIDGITYNVTEKSRNKNNNKEILKIVFDHIENLTTNSGYSAQRIKEALTNSFSKGFSTFYQVNGLRGIASKLDAVFGKYLMNYTENPETKEKTYNWELLPNLFDNNILVFRSKDGVVDFVDLTSFNVNANAGFKGRKNILGSYKTDSQFPDMEGTFGNIEAIRTMEFVNEVLPELGEVTLGKLTVLSTLDGNSYPYHIGEFNRKYFQKVIQTINSEIADIKIQNNFKSATFTDPVQEVLDEYIRIIQGKSRSEQLDYAQYGFDQLQEAKTKLEQINALQNLLQSITSIYYNFNNQDEVKKLMNSSNPTIRNMAILYELCTRAYLQLTDMTPTIQSTYSKINSEFFTPVTVKDSNLRLVADNIQITHDSIAEEFLKDYDDNIRPQFDQFYKEIGYTSLDNIVFGRQATQFENMYERDENGNNLMIFKNPYDNTNDLKPSERKLLKHVLFRIAKINSNGNFKFSSPTDSRLPEYINKHQDYLWVPLERASTATSRQSKKAWIAKFNNTWRKIKDFSNSFDEFINGMTDEERNLYGNSDEFYKLNLRNPFELSVPVTGQDSNAVRTRRAQLISKYGPEFFETNLENILIDFLSQHISTTKYNRLLVGTKALILQLSLTGDFNGNQKVVEEEINWIQDYIRANIFNDPNLTKEEEIIVGVISPVKRVVNHLLLAGNVVGAFRDCIQGAQQNFIRSVIKLGTDLNVKDVTEAYTYVQTHSTINPMAQNLLSKLNLRFRISNMDQARIRERAKTARSGITNIENGFYFTLRGPDFLNRMTLFVARCIHDGVWDAFSLDNEGKLVYDWTKDKRFRAYKYGTVGSEEYRKAKSLYFSQIRMYNKEHPDTPITAEDDLPSPYTNTEMNVIRGLADNIYGAYDKSKKAMVENRASGFTFLNFFTWMNGVINTYFMSAQKNKTSKLKRVQEVDDQGNKLFWDKDGNITTENTGDIVWDNVPCPVVGILPMLNEARNIMVNDGWKAAMKYLKSDDVYKANSLKLTSDGLMWLLWALFFKLAADPAYKDHKKTMKDNPVLVNLLTEVLYKSSSRAYDDFKGPLNVLQYFGENLNPPMYSQPVEIMKDAYSLLIGEKNLTYFLLDNTGFTRSFRDTGKAYFDSLNK